MKSIIKAACFPIFTRRIEDIEKVLVIVEESPVMIDFWQKYRKKYNYAADVTWEMVTSSVKMLLKKITKEITK